MVAKIILLFVQVSNAQGLNETQYNLLISDTNKVLKPIVYEKFGKAFLATGNWQKEYSRSSAGGSFYHPNQEGVEWEDSWGVHIVGWLARLPFVNMDSMQFVFCHELGHHLFGPGGERESDYFAPECLSWVWTEESSAQWTKTNSASDKTTQICSTIEKVTKRRHCLRALTAFEGISKLRAWVWRKHGDMSDKTINEINSCREAVVVQATTGQEFLDCTEF